MAINRAISFLNSALFDADFRKECIKLGSQTAVLETYGFSDFELEDAINMQLVKCQTYEQAEKYQHIKVWFSML